MIAYYGAYQQLFFVFTLYKPAEARIENKKGDEEQYGLDSVGDVRKVKGR